MAEPTDLPFRLWTRVGRRKHKFNRIRQVAPMYPHGTAHWRPLANTTEPWLRCGLMSNYFDHLLLSILKSYSTRLTLIWGRQEEWMFEEVICNNAWLSICHHHLTHNTLLTHTLLYCLLTHANLCWWRVHSVRKFSDSTAVRSHWSRPHNKYSLQHL